MKIKPFYQFLLLVFCTLGIYYPTLFAPFNSLDDQLLVHQLMNQDGFSFARHFSPGGTYDYFRPLLTLTFEVDKYLGGLQEAFMHFVNVLLHTFNVVLIYLLTRRLCFFVEREPGWLPFLAAVLFALHPINAEAVNWIMGRTDLMAGSFVFLTLLLLLRSFERRSLLWAAGSAVTLLLGTLCKETALFMVPGACFLLICRPVAGPDSWRLRWLIPGFYGVAVAGYFVLRWGAFTVDRGLSHTSKLVTHIAESTIQPVSAVTTDAFPLFDAARSLLKASGFYATKLFQPLPLNFAIYRVEALYIIPGVALIFVLVFLAWRRQLADGLFLVSASIAVSALFVVLTGLAWTPLAERYMYIPCGIFSIALTLTVAHRVWPPAWNQMATIVLPLVLCGAAWATTNRNIVWQDNLTLYQDTVAKSPGFAPAVNELAMALKAHNRHDEASKLIADNKMPAEGAASLNVAAVSWERGDYAAARGFLLQRLAGNPGAQETKILEMLISMTTEHLKGIDDDTLKRKSYKDIIAWLERITEISSTGFNYYRIGRIHLILKNKVAAQEAFAAAAKRFPEDSIYKQPATKLARDLAQ